jgi:hypothetical protein
LSIVPIVTAMQAALLMVKGSTDGLLFLTAAE